MNDKKLNLIQKNIVEQAAGDYTIPDCTITDSTDTDRKIIDQTVNDHTIINSTIIDHTVIDRRELKPLLQKAYQIMNWYETATGCGIAMSFKRYSSLFLESNKSVCRFCNLCKACYPDYSCKQMHEDIQSRVQQDGSYIYTCNAGFTYWTSPVYTGGIYTGALMSGQVLAIPRKEAIEKFASNSKDMSKKEIADMFMEVPEKTHEEIEALAKLLLICAKKLSSFQNPASLESKSFITLKKSNLHDKERLLLAALRRGDKNGATKIMHGIFDILQGSDLNDMDFLKLYSIELTVLVYRAAGSPQEPAAEARQSRGSPPVENYNNCLRRLGESETVKELKENLQYMMDSLGLSIFSFSGIRHASALRRAERFIWENYSRKISLDEIAAASGLSAPYFSTIFREEMGKTLFSYLNQLRIEKASGLLRDSSLSIREISKTCGFEDQSWFSKIFRKHTGFSPGKYRELPASASRVLPASASRVLPASGSRA